MKREIFRIPAPEPHPSGLGPDRWAKPSEAGATGLSPAAISNGPSIREEFDRTAFADAINTGPKSCSCNGTRIRMYQDEVRGYTDDENNCKQKSYVAHSSHQRVSLK